MNKPKPTDRPPDRIVAMRVGSQRELIAIARAAGIEVIEAGLGWVLRHPLGTPPRINLTGGRPHPQPRAARWVNGILRQIQNAEHRAAGVPGVTPTGEAIANAFAAAAMAPKADRRAHEIMGAMHAERLAERRKAREAERAAAEERRRERAERARRDAAEAAADALPLHLLSEVALATLKRRCLDDEARRGGIV